ncbi:MAG: aminoglycoside phosphotransferase family protein [Mojavia pulchra JT2-VF2]|uniref:Aminoglycoside phosphotransferase family protein n=1 Tax=Mojavia pulchra JT2-VF2 TaxID=287848 RepID=A0A951PW23_9NOST|nr:aminoglycoside phosphotransferase family protein [Mojavia pulchra JT2-VF2]
MNQKMDLLSQALNLEKLLALIATHLNVDPAELQLVPIPTGKHNSSFWVFAPQKRYVLRVAPRDSTGLLFYERRMMRQEPSLHELIRSRTTIPVAQIIAADFSRVHLDQDYLLMTALEGVPLSDAPSLSCDQHDQTLYQVGSYLRQLHELTAPDCLGIEAYGYIGLHHPMEPQPTWAEAFRVMWNLLLDDVVASGCYTLSDRQLMSNLLEQHIAHFDYTQSPRLLHMDVWSQNILVDPAGNVTGLVDFDRALWGDPEIEFAVLDYCGISEPAFWKGYGRERDQSTSAVIRQRFYLLYEVQKYIAIAVWRRRDELRALSFKHKSLALANNLL